MQDKTLLKILKNTLKDKHRTKKLTFAEKAFIADAIERIELGWSPTESMLQVLKKIIFPSQNKEVGESQTKE